jgi:hypothetical protein
MLSVPVLRAHNTGPAQWQGRQRLALMYTQPFRATLRSDEEGVRQIVRLDRLILLLFCL